MDVGDKARGIFWNGETFTRLILGTTDALAEVKDELPKEWKIQYYPLQPKYAGAAEYRNIVLPVLHQEWKTCARVYKELHTCSGHIKDLGFVESLEENAVLKSIFWVWIQIPKTKFWCQENRFAIGKITLDIQVLNKRVRIY